MNATLSKTLAVLATAGAVAGTVTAAAKVGSAEQSQVSAATAVEASQVEPAKQALIAGIDAMISAGTPSQDTQKRQMSAVTSKQFAPAVDAATLTTLRNQGQSRLSQYYTQDRLAWARADLDYALQMDRDPNRSNLGKSFTGVQYRSVSVAGNSAQVEVEGLLAAKFWERRGADWHLINPQSQVIYTGTLVRDGSGVWRISTLKMRFANGSGP